MTVLADVVTPDARRRAYLASGAWDGVTLPARAALHASRRPDDRAVIAEDGAHLTYAELWDRATRVAGFLAAEGIGAGDVVSVQLPNRLETAVVARRRPRRGCGRSTRCCRTTEPVSSPTCSRPRGRGPSSRPAVHRDFDHEELVATTTSATGCSPVHVVCDPAPRSRRSRWTTCSRATTVPRSRPDRDAAAVSELIFTSGTEATPKAIMHTEQTTNFSVRVAAADLGVTDDDVVWMPSPLGHSTGFNYGLRFALYHGLPLVLQDRWDPAVAVDLVRRERCSYTLAATTFLQELVAESARRSAAPSTRLRCFGCGGAPVPPALVEEGEAHGVQVLRLYGSTEVLVATWNRPDAPCEHACNTDGRAMSGVEVDAARRRDLHPRARTRASASSPIPSGPQATFDADGWVRSGDLATLDADGYLTVVGRKKEIIIRGGMNITPREIEELIGGFAEVRRPRSSACPTSASARSCARASSSNRAPTLTLATIVDRLRDAGLATYKLPERLELLDASCRPPRRARSRSTRSSVASRSATHERSDRTRPAADPAGPRWRAPTSVAVTLVLNRPDQLNAIDWPMLDALDRALDDVVDDPQVRGVLVTGAGRAFSAGGDLVGYQTLQRDPVSGSRGSSPSCTGSSAGCGRCRYRRSRW